MSQRWEDYESAIEYGPWRAFWKILPFALGSLLVLWGIASVFGWFAEGAAVAREEFGPREALRKYEWFKDAAAQLDKKQADISIYEAQVAGYATDYGEDRKLWPRDVRTEAGQRQAELLGVRASYNTLAAEYNAQMAKFNYRFANRGMLPEGAKEPLPREFRTYQEGGRP